MNVQNLRDNYPKLISYMVTNGYSKTYVDSFKRNIKKILAAADSKEWSCYKDVYLEYTKKSPSPDTLRNKRTVIGALEQLDVHGRYPDGRRRHKLFENGKMSQTAVNKQLKKHARVAYEMCNEVPRNLHAHQLRHAKASHWS